MIYLILAAALAVGVIVVLRARRSSPATGGSWKPSPPQVAQSAALAPSAADEPDELARITARLSAQHRTAYVPVVQEGDGEAASSKFSGVPLLDAGEEWPACGNCGRPMQLFVQLAGSELPAAAQARIRPREVLQFFYCTSRDPVCEDECEAFAPHARSTLLRIGIPGSARDADAQQLLPGMFPPKRIVGWKEQVDYPGFDEVEEAGVQLTEDEMDILSATYPRFGEKLLGWPAWVQSAEYPECRFCGRRMELLFQVDSEDNLPFMFGDVGTGHITQCPTHREELAFGWACH